MLTMLLATAEDGLREPSENRHTKIFFCEAEWPTKRPMAKANPLSISNVQKL